MQTPSQTDQQNATNFRALQTDAAQEAYRHALAAAQAEHAARIEAFMTRTDQYYRTPEQPDVLLGHQSTADAQRQADDAQGGLVALACRSHYSAYDDAALRDRRYHD